MPTISSSSMALPLIHLENVTRLTLKSQRNLIPPLNRQYFRLSGPHLPLHLPLPIPYRSLIRPRALVSALPRHSSCRRLLSVDQRLPCHRPLYSTSYRLAKHLRHSPILPALPRWHCDLGCGRYLLGCLG